MKNGVYRLASGVVVVDVQSDLLAPTRTRVVVPLTPAPDGPEGQPRRLTPVIEIDGALLLALPLQMAAIPLRELGARPLRMLSEAEAYALSQALGVLFDGV